MAGGKALPEPVLLLTRSDRVWDELCGQAEYPVTELGLHLF